MTPNTVQFVLGIYLSSGDIKYMTVYYLLLQNLARFRSMLVSQFVVFLFVSTF